MSNFRFKKGMEVAHIGNLKQKLYVEKPLYKKKEIPSKVSTSKVGFDMEEVQFLEGIAVYCWVNGLRQDYLFHSALLVPWEIAEQGDDNADSWRVKNNPKFFKMP